VYFGYADHNGTQQGQNMQRNFSSNVNTTQLNQQSKNQAESSRNQLPGSDSLARLDDINIEDWYPDSGATNHLTSNI